MSGGNHDRCSGGKYLGTNKLTICSSWLVTERLQLLTERVIMIIMVHSPSAYPTDPGAFHEKTTSVKAICATGLILFEMYAYRHEWVGENFDSIVCVRTHVHLSLIHI